jgi:hypothetical protein
MATDTNKIFPGYQLYHLIKNLHFRDQLADNLGRFF